LNVFDSSNLEDQSRIVGIEPTLERDIDLADRKKISGSKEVKTDLVVEIDPIDAIAGKGSELDASQQKRETCAKEKDRPPASGPLRAWAPLALQGYRLDQRDLEALDRADTLSWQGKTPARLGWQKIMLLYYRAEWIKSFSWATKSPKPETFQIPYVIGMISKDSVQSSDYPKALKYCNDQCSRHSQSLSAVLAKGEQYPPEHEICLRQTQRTYFNPDDPNKPACAVCLKYSDEINKKASEESQGLFGPNAKKKRFVL
jgi:hypothetical protein